MNARPGLFIALCITLSLSLPAVAQPPQATIVAPSGGEQVTGQIKVRATADGTDAPKSFYIGIDKTCWTKMEQDKQTGEWTASLDSSLVPNGQRTIEI